MLEADTNPFCGCTEVFDDDAWIGPAAILVLFSEGSEAPFSLSESTPCEFACAPLRGGDGESDQSKKNSWLD